MVLRKKRKLLIVIGSFKIGGAERMAINVGEELRRNDLDVHYALQRPVFEIPHNIDTKFIHLLNHHTNKHKLLIHLNSIFQIFLLRLRLKPSCVIGFTYYSSFIACFSFAQNVIGRFDINPYIIKRKLRHRVATFVAKWPMVRKIVVPSFGIGDKLKGINPYFDRKIHVIHNSIDLEKVVELSLLTDLGGLDVERNYISAMGRLTNQKNYELLLTTYSKSKIKNKFDLVIIGDGSLKDKLIALSENLNVRDKVHFTGFLSNPFPIIRNSAFFINTSNFESFCNVILESLSLSIPVVATDCDFGPSEMIQSGFNGFLTPIRDGDALLGILDQIYADENIISDFKSRAAHSVEKFTLDKIGQSWVALIKEYS